MPATAVATADATKIVFDTVDMEFPLSGLGQRSRRFGDEQNLCGGRIGFHSQKRVSRFRERFVTDFRRSGRVFLAKTLYN